MRTASKISQRDQRFIDTADVLVSHWNADASSSKGIQHRPVAVVARPPSRFEDEEGDAPHVELPDESLQATASSPFGARGGPLVADDDDLDRSAQQVEP